MEGIPKRKSSEFPPPQALERDSVETPVPEAKEVLATPETFENVSFRIVRAKNGEPVGYRSSAMGRKEIRLDPSSMTALVALSTERGYRVRVVSDSDPSNPEKGYYVGEVVSELEHREAQVARAKRLRSSTGFKTVARLLNEDPDLSVEYRAVAERHKEYHNLHTEEGSRHRNFTGMLAGLMMSERGNDLLDRVIDRTISAESTTIKESLRTAEIPPYVRSVTIGAGVYGSIMAATRQMYLPDVPDLTIEQESRVGGQFAQYKKDLFRLNSRRRKELPDAPHVPGSAQSLNSFGKHSVMQSSDTGNESYPYQSTIADTARVNFFLSGKAMVNTELLRIVENNDPEIEGKLILELYDKDTQEMLRVATDRVINSTGLGEEADLLNPDDKITRTILAEEKQKFERGEDALVMSYSQMVRRMGDPTNPFPMKGMKRIVLSGNGDSANVLAGILLGYESQVGKTATQLDSVEEIIWIGQNIESKEKFLEQVRVRYAQIGLEFPRGQIEKYYSRIRPIPGARSYQLDRSGNGIRVKISNERGRAFFKRQKDIAYDDKDGAAFVEGDHFIYAHGFTDTTDATIAPAFAEEYDPDDFQETIEDIKEGSTSKYSVYFKEGYIQRADISYIFFDGGELVYDLILVTNERKVITEQVTERELVARVGLNVENIARITRTNEEDIFRITAQQDTEYAKVWGKNTPVAKSFTTANGGEIYKVGPAAKIPLGSKEAEEVPALKNIPANTASIFRSVDPVEAFAERLARSDQGERVKRSPFLSDLSDARVTALPSREESDERTTAFSTSIRFGGYEKLGLEEQSSDMLKLAMGDCLAPFTFPNDIDELQLTYVRMSQGKSASSYKVLVEPTLPYEYGAIIRAIKGDTLAAGVIKKITDAVQSHAVTIRIPINKGKADGAGTTFQMRRISERERGELGSQ